MPWGYAAAAVGTYIAADSAGSAADTQAGAARDAAGMTQAQFNTINNQQAPYRAAGQQGLYKLQNMLGIGTPESITGLAWPGVGRTSAQIRDASGQLINQKPQGPSSGYIGGFDPMSYGTAGGSSYTGGNLPPPPTKPTWEEFGGTGGAPGWVDPNFDRASFNKAAQAYDIDIRDYADATGLNLADSDPNSLMHRFNANDLNANLAPNWQFALQQGQGATQNMANASGGMLSGNTLKGISDYTLGASGNLYQQAFQNYTGNQTNIYNRLSSIAGLGQTANQATAAAGVPLAQSGANSIMAAGASQAAGTVGRANAISGGLNNAAGWYGVNNMNNPSTTPSTYGTATYPGAGQAETGW